MSEQSKTPRTTAFAAVTRGLGTGYYQAIEEMARLELSLSDELEKAQTELAQAKEEVEKWKRREVGRFDVLPDTRYSNQWIR